jgi:hypothetical protein
MDLGWNAGELIAKLLSDGWAVYVERAELIISGSHGQFRCKHDGTKLGIEMALARAVAGEVSR